jgi:MYXO-CTERM domain-containing protein
MKVFGALALLLLAALAVPTASAQVADALTVEPGSLSAPIPYAGSANLPVNGTVGCSLILQAMAGGMSPSAPLTLAVTSPPSWLTVGEASEDLASQDSVTACAGGQGSRSFALELPLTVTKDAPGIVDHTLNITATLGDRTSDPVAAIITVAYHVNYTIVADAKFPLMVNGTQATFNVTITQASNARSMVMIEKASSSTGVFSGVPAVVYENDGGKPVSKTYLATFKAPDGDWTNATATFTGFGHYLLLDGRAGVFGEDNCKKEGLAFPQCDVTGTTVTYSFVPGTPAGHDDEEEDQKSPAPVGAVLALGLVGLAAFARRRA